MTESIRRTRSALRLVLGRRDGVFVTATTAGGYLVLYLAATRALVTGRGELGVLVADDPLTLLFRQNGPMSFEPIALLDLWVARLLVSPVELLLAGAIATLVGLNLALTYLAWRQPQACGLSPGAGLFAAIPALLSGSACCAPVILIVLGVQVSGLFIAVVDVLLPVSVALLVVGLVLVSRRVQPDSTRRAPGS